MKILLFIFSFALLTLPSLAFAQEFKPLTSIPAFQAVANTDNLADFLNTVYKLCIGIAAILAIFQIVRSGIIYMLGDTGFFEKREAKANIMRALFGLLLVLSPAIVFGIIDPRILSLRIDVTSIGADPQVSTNGGTPGGDPSDETPTGSNSKTFSVAAGYIIAVGGHFQEYPNCYLVAVRSYTTQEQCQAALQTSQQADADTGGDTHYYHSCTQTAGGEVTITANEPICD